MKEEGQPPQGDRRQADGEGGSSRTPATPASASRALPGGQQPRGGGHSRGGSARRRGGTEARQREATEAGEAPPLAQSFLDLVDPGMTLVSRYWVLENVICTY